MMLSVVLFRWRTRENVVPIVDKLSGRMGTPFLLLKCLRTHYGQHCEPFSVKHALDCRILHIQSQNFPGVIPRTPAKMPPVFGPIHLFPLG